MKKGFKTDEYVVPHIRLVCSFFFPNVTDRVGESRVVG